MITHARRTEFETRDAILKLLSDDEIARVSTREAGPPLGPGEEYLDLKHLKHGVRYMTSMTHVKISDLLPRNVLSDETWSKICARLSS